MRWLSWMISMKTHLGTGSVVQSCLIFAAPWTAACQAFCLSPSPGACSNSRPTSHWCHSTILSSVALFSSCPQSFPVSGYFPMSWLLVSGGQNIGLSASAPVLPKNIQDCFPLGWAGLSSLLSKGLSRVFLSTTVGK